MANISSQQKKILDIGVSVARAISGELNLNYRGGASTTVAVLVITYRHTPTISPLCHVMSSSTVNYR